MQLQLTTEYHKAIYQARLKYPGWTQKQIAESLNVSQSLVSKIDRKRKVAVMIRVPEHIMKRAYQSMEETGDMLEMYITELEELKSEKKETITVDEKGNRKKAFVSQTPSEVSNLIKMQIDTVIKLNELRTIEEPDKVLDWIGKNNLSEITK